MSSKFSQGLSKESSELQKQIGCITGIFQMFDRHNLHGGRRINHKLPSGLPSIYKLVHPLLYIIFMLQMGSNVLS